MTTTSCLEEGEDLDVILEHERCSLIASICLVLQLVDIGWTGRVGVL